MNKTLIALLLISITLLIMSQCSKREASYIIPKIDTKPIRKKISNLETEIKDLKQLATVKDSDRVKHVKKWRELKRNLTRLPCDSILPVVINTCDSIVVSDSSYIHTQRQIIAAKDSLIAGIWSLHRADSTNAAGTIDSLGARLKHAKKGYIRGFIHGFTVGNATGVSLGVSVRR